MANRKEVKSGGLGRKLGLVSENGPGAVGVAILFGLLMLAVLV